MNRKFIRNLLRILVSVAAIVLIALLLCLDRVDYRPYFREPYYRETMSRLRAHSATNITAKGEIWAGFGRARLTPTVHANQDDPSHGKFRELPLAGYGQRGGKPAAGAHDDLFVKCAAIRVGSQLGVMLGADALIIPREVSDMAAAQLQKEFGLKREQLYFSATHSHSSLGGWAEGKVGEAFSGKFNPGAREWFADCIEAAVREAIADLKPASFGHGSFSAPEFVRNRLIGDAGKSDPEFSYAVLRQANGSTSVLGSFSAHATVLSGSVMEFSADYPGYWQRAVEQGGVSMAVFLAGGVGSHGPISGKGGFKGAEHMGQSLAKMFQESVARIVLTNQVEFTSLGVDVSLPSLNVRLTDGIRLRPWISSKFLPAQKLSYIQMFRIADSLWISTPCDFSGELAMPIKDNLRARGFSAVITSFNGDYIGYLIPCRYYHLSGYEPRLMSFYGPYVPDYFDELIRSMATEVLKN